VVPESDTPLARRKLRIDLDDLEVAFDDGSPEMAWYLSLETGQVIMVTDETRTELERILKEAAGAGDERPAAFADALARRNLPEWMQESVQEAADVEGGYPDRYIAVPRAESRDGYGDMEEFIETVRSDSLQDRLWCAISGRGAFRRFKDVLEDYPQERERWFGFRDARVRQRVLDWLEEEGIEPIAK
jgi:hypothetical protein